MNLIQVLEKEQAEKLSAGKEIPDFGPGDTVLVNYKVVEGERSRIQAYEGVCIGRAGAGFNENFGVACHAAATLFCAASAPASPSGRNMWRRSRKPPRPLRPARSSARRSSGRSPRVRAPAKPAAFPFRRHRQRSAAPACRSRLRYG